jgi:hypothetical protein
MLACEQQLKDFLPTAIDRLLELAAGVTVQYSHRGQTLTITHKPNARAIDYITSRTEGRFASVLTDLREKFENPNLDYPYTAEDFEKMTQAERDALYDCALRNVDHFADKKSGFDDDDADPQPSHIPAILRAYDSRPSTSPPSPACGRCSLPGFLARSAISGDAGRKDRAVSEDEAERGDGGEGYPVGGEGYNDGCKCDAAAGAVINLPTYITATNKRLADFLPTAITHLKTLAVGAQTIIDSEAEQHVINYGPDLKANMFFVNRFLGTAPTTLKIENVTSPMAPTKPTALPSPACGRGAGGEGYKLGM